MTRSAIDVMQEIIFAAVVDSLDALKGAAKGVPNNLLREINAIHANARFADLPKELQAAITASVRTSFNRLLKEGYAVAPRDVAPQRAPARLAPPSDRRGPPRGKPPVQVTRKPKPRGPR